VHVPDWHVSLCVHALPSLHAVPFAAFGFEHDPVCGSQTPATWHWSLAEQTTGLAPVHVPAWQLSDWVHALPSLQAVPFAAFGFEQDPVCGLQTPATWHWSLAVHVTGLAPVHVPDWHVSLCVHAFPSLHAAPSAALGFEQDPVCGSQTPATWHWSLAVHVTGLAPVQAPDWHVSLCVHAFPSLHAVPFAAFGFVQVPVPGLHTPATWH